MRSFWGRMSARLSTCLLERCSFFPVVVLPLCVREVLFRRFHRRRGTWKWSGRPSVMILAGLALEVIGTYTYCYEPENPAPTLCSCQISTYNRSDNWSEQGSKAEYYHRCTSLLLYDEIGESSTPVCERTTSSYSCKKSKRNKHSGIITNSTSNGNNQK